LQTRRAIVAVSNANPRDRGSLILELTDDLAVPIGLKFIGTGKRLATTKRRHLSRVRVLNINQTLIVNMICCFLLFFHLL
jgi:hypothetical protein